MRLLRSTYRSVVFVGLLLAAVAHGQWRKMFRGMKVGADGAVWVSAWCRRIVRALSLVCEVEGQVPEASAGGLAVVANHLSYLDILVMSAVRPFVMVSKCEVRGWPLLGWITAQAGTVYVERADVKGGQTQTHAEVNAMMAAAFRSGLPVLFFPEGTTTSGDGVLPFRRGLFNSVVYDRVPVKTAALAYAINASNVGCTVGEDVCFVGDAEFGPHLFKALGLKGVKVRVRFGAETIAGEDRFALALNARDSVCELYEAISGVCGLERGVEFPSLQRQQVLYGMVERAGSLRGEAGVQG
jgi:1-acyl-sn-glycerol-3-phosphate acyltransferase